MLIGVDRMRRPAGDVESESSDHAALDAEVSARAGGFHDEYRIGRLCQMGDVLSGSRAAEFLVGSHEDDEFR